MWIVIAVVMGAVLLGKIDERHSDDESIEPGRSSFISEDLTIVRHDDEPAEFSELGVVVNPTDGWSSLKIVNRETPFGYTFVNEESGLIARITPFPNVVWPPELRAKPTVVIPPSFETDETPDLEFPKEKPVTLQRIQIPIESKKYRHVSIEWIRLKDNPTRGAQKLIGRIETGEFDALITVVFLREESEQNADVTSFCDQIRRISKR